MKPVLFIFGTRPEAIELCPVIQEMRRHAALAVRVLVHRAASRHARPGARAASTCARTTIST